MHQAEERITINIPLEECLQLWMAYDHYPNFVFAELPSIPDKWSSANAWGENTIGGSRHLNWSIISYPSKVHKQIFWHVQNTIQQHIINISGLVTFETYEVGKTEITMTIGFDNIPNTVQNPILAQLCPNKVLRKQLETFRSLAHQIKCSSEAQLKVAV